jgi:hypothetical protein
MNIGFGYFRYCNFPAEVLCMMEFINSTNCMNDVAIVDRAIYYFNAVIAAL